MQLFNMDVEHHGLRGPTQIGPLSPALNALCGPKGSGKTTLLHWLRSLAAEGDISRHDGVGTAWIRQESPVVGSVEISNRGQRFRLASDRAGRKSQTVSGLDTLSPLQRDVFTALASATGATDTEAALETLVRRLGLDQVAQLQDPRHTQTLQRQAEIETALLRIRTLNSSRESLLTRRAELEAELRDARDRWRDNDHRRSHQRYAAIEAELRQTLAELEASERELADLRAELKLLESTTSSVQVDESYRLQLQEIDDRLTRWRQTLRDLKSHRNRIEHSATDAQLDLQVGDQLSLTKQADPRVALRSLEAQILSARKQLDGLVDRYSVFQERRTQDLPSASLDSTAGPGEQFGKPLHREYAVQKDIYGNTRIAYHDGYAPDPSNLPETLRNMQKDLYEACQQLARHESRAASDTLKQQSQQLHRCETELLRAVEKLIEERAELLRKIADECHVSADQLSVAFGNWCECHDHEHLQDWLLNDAQVKTPRKGIDPIDRQRLLDRIEAVEAARKVANLRAEDCRRQLRDAEVHRHELLERRDAPRGRQLEEIQREYDAVVSDLRDWDQRELLLREQADLRQRLAAEAAPAAGSSRFRDSVDRHIVGLMGGRQRLSARGGYRNGLDHAPRRYDLVDGIVYDYDTRGETDVPAALVRVALRLAIAESVAARGEPISLLLDESLDQLDAVTQSWAVTHLASVASMGQQVIILTADERVADLVRSQRGWVGYLATGRTVELDINRHLTALANDYEADKWYQPATRPEPVRSVPLRGEFYLTERSRVEESPSIDTLVAARCCEVGVDRIGDLLDVDPRWLAGQLRSDGVTESTVVSWQAEARLLCAVRQLRPFDARLLVSIGVHTPQQLADMHPSQLLERVERFLGTDRGRRFLRSGSSYELSRITTWIASAKGGAGDFHRSSFIDDDYSANARNDIYARSRGDRRAYPRNEKQYPSRSADAALRDDEFEPAEFEASTEYRNGDSHRNLRPPRSRSTPLSPRERSSRSSARPDRDYPSSNGREKHQPRRESSRSEREPYPVRDSKAHRQPRRTTHDGLRSDGLKLANAEFDSGEPLRLKFYLELASPVVDAPSIGPRMSSRLEKFGIVTVDQLLAANADSLTDKLNLRRVDAQTIRSWQEQARLVCRIPNLRGHDAQLLVACNLTSPEELATMSAANVLAQVTLVAESPEGQRILRGSKQPDLAEVSDWIHWASQCRALSAA